MVVDTPGIGDLDVTPVKLMSMIEDYLAPARSTSHLDGVIVTNCVPAGRLTLGAQVTHSLVDRGFVGKHDCDETKWQNIILVGTKEDHLTLLDDAAAAAMAAEAASAAAAGGPAPPPPLPEHQQPGQALRNFFMADVKPRFFAKAKGQQCQAVLTHQGNIDRLEDALNRLPQAQINFQKPDIDKLCEDFFGNPLLAEVLFKDFQSVSDLKRAYEQERTRSELSVRALQKKEKELHVTDQNMTGLSMSLNDAEQKIKMLQNELYESRREATAKKHEAVCAAEAAAAQAQAHAALQHGNAAQAQARAAQAEARADDKGREAAQATAEATRIQQEFTNYVAARDAAFELADCTFDEFYAQSLQTHEYNSDPPPAEQVA